MSLNNLPNNLPSVEKLLQRVASAERSQQKEIRITIQEAKELTAELAIMTSKLGKTIQDIHSMLLDIKNNSEKIDIKFDGGGFN